MKKVFLILGIIFFLNLISITSVIAQDTINIGTGPNSRNGDPLRTAFIKTNHVIKAVRDMQADTITLSSVALMKSDTNTYKNAVTRSYYEGHIKTVNGNTLIGTGNLAVSGANVIDALNAMGADIKAMPIGANVATMGTSGTMGDGTLYLIPVYFYTAATVTYLGANVATLGVYTSDNYNGMGLYSYSAGTLTLERSTTDDGAAWSTSLGLIKKSITSYSASAGQLMYIGILWNSSATTTAPQVARSAGIVTSGTQFSSYFTNSNSICKYVTSQNTLPSTVTLSSASNWTQAFFVTAH